MVACGYLSFIISCCFSLKRTPLCCKKVKKRHVASHSNRTAVWRENYSLLVCCRFLCGRTTIFLCRSSLVSFNARWQARYCRRPKTKTETPLVRQSSSASQEVNFSHNDLNSFPSFQTIGLTDNYGQFPLQKNDFDSSFRIIGCQSHPAITKALTRRHVVELRNSSTGDPELNIPSKIALLPTIFFWVHDQTEFLESQSFFFFFGWIW